MYERFTAMARTAVAQSEIEAHTRGGTEVEPEDLLVALAVVPGVAGSVLRAVAADPDILREAVGRHAPDTDHTGARPLPLSPLAMEVFFIAGREADGLAQDYVATEHLLLGVLRESSGRATTLLHGVRRDPSLVRERILDLISSVGFISPELAPATRVVAVPDNATAVESLVEQLAVVRAEVAALRSAVARLAQLVPEGPTPVIDLRSPTALHSGAAVAADAFVPHRHAG